jgi:hypothetical protein
MKSVFKIALINILFSISIIHSQVLNIDRENGQDSVKRKSQAAFMFSFSSDKQKKNIIDIANTSEFALFFKKQLTTIFLSQVELSMNGPQVIENNGFFQLRFRDNDSRKFYPDFFAQYQWNGILGLEKRGLIGVNGRFNFFEKRESDFYASVGVFSENERWNPSLSSFAFFDSSLVSVSRNLFRLNLSSKFALKINKKIDIAGSTFVQFPFNSNFKNPRWFFDTNIFFKIDDHWNFVIHYDHNFDRYRPLPIDDYYYNFTFGAQIKF